MQLKAPFLISARLLPAVKIGDVFISLRPYGRTDDNRARWKYYLDAPTWKYYNADLAQGVGSKHDTQRAMASMLSFLGACAESIAYATRTGRKGENADLFPANVGEWAQSVSDELTALEFELDENVTDADAGIAERFITED